MINRSKIFYRINLALCAVPILSVVLLYSLTFHVWYKYRVWPFRDSNPDYNQFTGLLKFHDIFSTVFIFYLMPVSFCFWIFGILDLGLNKKESIKRVIFLFSIFGIWWLILYFDPYNILKWFLD